MTKIKELSAAVGLIFVMSVLIIVVYCAFSPDPPDYRIPVFVPASSTAQMSSGDLYLDLLKKNLTRYIHPEVHGEIPFSTARYILHRHVYYLKRFLVPLGLDVVILRPFNPIAREEGRDESPDMETMIGLKRLDNLQTCVSNVIARRIPGDLIEAGAWRGGATIFMRAALKVYGDHERKVWVSDSFAGFPKWDKRNFPQDANLWAAAGVDAVSLDEVKENFARYGMLDEQVCFLKGYFKDTLPTAPIKQLAILRVDADMYESTMQALTYLYPKLSPGGYVIVDDYAIENARQAVNDYRAKHGITEPIQHIDWTGIFWLKEDRNGAD